MKDCKHKKVQIISFIDHVFKTKCCKCGEEFEEIVDNFVCTDRPFKQSHYED